ncbi:DUF2809 domain-containing protein [Mucilaginibacter sp. CSA2-8R]|uniref:ribosomal maturation YjgA family protein n=1 Tax=Mucilaginibacter sp. CSA2-8R TaxID=3141542 RepID=UPI00315C979A
MTLQIDRPYCYLTVLLLAIEIFIGLFVHDAWIRPYGGDFLVVILLYCLVKSFLRSSYRPVAIGVLLFAYLTETMQYLHVAALLGLQHNQFACIIIGTQFSWTDTLMYTLGIALVWWVEF